MRTAVLSLWALWLCLGVAIAAPATASTPVLREVDRVRLAEAYALARSLPDLWPAWDTVPFAVLLVTEEDEFLLRHPAPPKDAFQSLGYDPVLESDVLHRSATGRFSPELLATFPAVGGVNTVVVGTAERTGKSSTLWVLTLLHEHFHQWQYTREDYYSAVASLDLDGGDTTGMWQLNFPFAYEDEEVGEAVARYRSDVAAALEAAAAAAPAEVAKGVIEARAHLRATLSAADHRYLDFQLWQEGVARYTELLVAREAIGRHTPTEAFSALADVVSYAQALALLEAQLARELSVLDLARHRREAFYPLGAQEALLLDRVHPLWRERYYRHKFSLGALLPRGGADTRVVE
ncbi:MAG: hypothetical protein AAF184_10290 [Pseudomonadota bacterium]